MKYFKKVVACLAILLALTGCVKMDMSVKIIDEDTAEVSMTMLYQEEMFESMGSQATQLDDMMDKLEDEGVKVKEIEKEIDGENYIGFEATGTNNSQSKSLLDELHVTKEDGKEVYSLYLDLNSLSNNDAFGSSNGSSGFDNNFSYKAMQNMGVEMTIAITMPYDIEEASEGTVDGDTVTIDILDLITNEVDEVEIIAREGSGGFGANLYLILAAAVIIIAGISIFVILKVRKSNVIPENMNNESTPSLDTPINNNTTNEAIDTATPEKITTKTSEVVENETNTSLDTDTTKESETAKEGVETKKEVIEPEVVTNSNENLESSTDSNVVEDATENNSDTIENTTNDKDE